MESPASGSPPFGTYAPSGLTRLLIDASRHTPLGHAETRRFIWNFVRKRQDQFDLGVGSALMRLHPSDSSLERVLLLRPQKYCPGEIAFLRRTLRSGGTLVDAGANIGAFSLPMAALPGVEVISVEANPVALARLRFNIAASGYGNVKVVPVALAGADGVVSFFVHGSNIGLSGIGQAWAEGEQIEVTARTFASVLSDAAVRSPYVLKIDVERHEDIVLMPFFQSTPKAQWPRHLLIETIKNQGVPDCVAFLLSNGYRKSFESRQNTGLSDIDL